MIGLNRIKATKLIILLLGSCLLSSCAVYSGGFNCPDSKGANCMMFSDVDRIVDSGEIESIHRTAKCKKHKNSKCIANDVPKLRTNPVLQEKTEYFKDQN